MNGKIHRGLPRWIFFALVIIIQPVVGAGEEGYALPASFMALRV